MATFYSSFFSSGLLAPQPHGPQPHGPQPHGPQPHGPQPHGPQPLVPQPSSPSTPRQGTLSLDHDITPTALPSSRAPGPASTLLPSIALPESNPTHDDARPRLRRRRSSLTTATTPLTAIKSSTAHRAAAVSHRQSLIAARARSGSDASTLSASPPAEPGAATPGARRLRSGSLGTALRHRRAACRNAPPAPPPPTSPLPALPLPRRAHIADGALPAALGLAPACEGEDGDECGCGYEYALPASPGYPPLGTPYVYGPRKTPLDYPSPIDGEGCPWGRGTKEN